MAFSVLQGAVGQTRECPSTVEERGIECGKPVGFLFSGILERSFRGTDAWVLFSYSAMGLMHYGSEYSRE